MDKWISESGAQRRHWAPFTNLEATGKSRDKVLKLNTRPLDHFEIWKRCRRVNLEVGRIIT